MTLGNVIKFYFQYYDKLAISLVNHTTNHYSHYVIYTRESYENTLGSWNDVDTITRVAFDYRPTVPELTIYYK